MFQQELFSTDQLVARLAALGLRGVSRVTTHRNSSTMLSVTAGGVLRVHQGYAFAPDDILRAIVRFVQPGIRRRTRSELQKRILAFPVQSFVGEPRVRRRRSRPPNVKDEQARQQVCSLFERLNATHFDHLLPAVPIRLSPKMRSRLGELLLDAKTGQAVEIAISYRHIQRDGWPEVEHTLLHEMIHLWQSVRGYPVDHGRTFREKARAVGVEPRATRAIDNIRRGQRRPAQ